MNGQLPRWIKAATDSSSSRLTMWLQSVRKIGVYAKPEKRKMLEEVHPLVKELLQNWDDRPLQIHRARWEKQLEKVLHIVKKHDRLPHPTCEPAEYKWLRTQLRRLDFLPPEPSKRLCSSHPLLAAAAAKSSEPGVHKSSSPLNHTGRRLRSRDDNILLPWCVCCLLVPVF